MAPEPRIRRKWTSMISGVFRSEGWDMKAENEVRNEDAVGVKHSDGVWPRILWGESGCDIVLLLFLMDNDEG